MDVQTFLDGIRASRDYSDQIVHQESLPHRTPVYGALRHTLAPLLEQAMRDQGVEALYRHQTSAIDALLDGHNVILATGPASGKSLCYHLPSLNAIMQNNRHRALYIFPTKALAQDQLRVLNNFCSDGVPVAADIFDGDTPRQARSTVKRSAQVVITNPDMLHVGILPNHKTWGRLFRNLCYVVLDEAHIYRGVFGSHVANVIRRLRRICRRYGSDPRFVLCSATVANPRELAETLVGLPFQVVGEDGAPSGAKQFVFWNPPVVDQARGTRKSATSEATDLFRHLVRRQIRTLVFTRTRRQVEMVYTAVRRYLVEEAPHLLARVSPYRGTYLPEDRRRIERRLFSGELLGVASTNALELGIDIGILDATILAGYPGSISSCWQQAGRSGRRQDTSLSILVARNDPLDQYLMKNPRFFFESSHEHALTSPQNPRILGPHIICAGYEAAPLTQEDTALFGETFMEHIRSLEKEGVVQRRGEHWYLSPRVTYPAQDINVRSSTGHTYAVVDTQSGALIEEIDENSAFSQLYPGAVYFHYGEQYLVEDLNTTTRAASVSAQQAPYYTVTRETTDLRILRVLSRKKAAEVMVYLGEVEVSKQIISYEKKAQFTEETLGEEIVDLPPLQFETVALWFDVPADLLKWMRGNRLDIAGGLHAAEHCAIGILPLFALCDRADIGGVSTPLHPDTGVPQVFIYDGHPGGVGIAEKGYALIEELWSATLQPLEECPCDAGCPACVHSPKCGNGNHPLDKGVASMLLRGCLGLTIHE